jgi:PBP1b-binding outer membrane lipoprotein LpoB
MSGDLQSATSAHGVESVKNGNGPMNATSAHVVENVKNGNGLMNATNAHGAENVKNGSGLVNVTSVHGGLKSVKNDRDQQSAKNGHGLKSDVLMVVSGGRSHGCRCRGVMN